MCLSNPELDEYILRRDLIAISRDDLDSHKVQGFPLAYSPSLLLIRYVYDFHLDGLLLVRRSDITDVNCRGTDKFQRKLLETENKLKRGLFQSNYSIGNFSAFLESLDPNRIVIIENEFPESTQFFIGRVLGTNKQFAQLQEFSGTGRWEQKPTKIPLAEITCCQLETNYINFYARHFKRASE